jgi:hypothetical protein
MKSRKLLEWIFKKSLERTLANRYLTVSSEVTGRLVNISATLQKA